MSARKHAAKAASIAAGGCNDPSRPCRTEYAPSCVSNRGRQRADSELLPAAGLENTPSGRDRATVCRSQPAAARLAGILHESASPCRRDAGLAHAFVGRPIKVQRMRESSFAVRCLASGLNLPPFSVVSSVGVIVLRRIVIRLGHVKISPSETIKGTSTDTPPTDRFTRHQCQMRSFSSTIQHRAPPRRDSGLLEPSCAPERKRRSEFLLKSTSP